MDIQTILFIILFTLVGFCIIYNVIVRGAWQCYHKVDEQILDLKGEEVDATFESYEKDSDHKNCYRVKMKYKNSFGETQTATLASYNIIRKDELNYLKKHPVRALAYKDLMEVDLTGVSTTERSFGSVIFLIVKQLLVVFSKRCGFPPKHLRKKMLKEIKENEQ